MVSWDVRVEPPTGSLPGQSQFISKRAVTEWFDALPVISADKTAVELHAALGDVTGHELPYAVRLFFLEKTSPLLYAYVRELLRAIHRGGLPVQRDALKRAGRMVELLAQSVVGYRQVLDVLRRSMFAGGLRRGRLLGLTLLRIMELLGQAFEIYRYTAIPPAAGLWRLYKQTYSLAEAGGLLNSHIARLHGKGRQTIYTAFRSQVLREGLNYYALRSDELEQAKTLVESLAHSVSISREGDNSQPYRFCFRLDEDLPPSRYATDMERQCQVSTQRRVLNMAPLIDELVALLVKEDDRAETGGEEYTVRLLAQQMLNEWRGGWEGRDERVERESPVRVSIGLSQIASLVASDTVRPFGLGETLASNDETLVLSDSGVLGFFGDELDSLAVHEEEGADGSELWEIVPYVPASRYGAVGGGSLPLLVHGNLNNQSHNGYGVVLPMGEERISYRAGELIAVEVDSEWVLCSIRWISPRGEDVWMGLARLGEELKSHSLVISRNGKASEPLPLLLLRHRSGEPAIVLHNRNLRSRHPVNLADDYALMPDDLLDFSSDFVCYRIDETFCQRLEDENGLALGDGRA